MRSSRWSSGREWLAGKKDLRSTTKRSYESHLRLYLIPHLGRVRLDRLRVAHLHAMFQSIEDRNEEIAANNAHRKALQVTARAAWHARDLDAARTAQARLAELPPFERPVGPGSRQRIRATARSALTDASAQELVTVNVAKLVKLASESKPRPLIWTRERVAVWRKTGEVPSAVMVWTAEQTMRFLARVAKAKDLYALFHLVAVTGLRRGEVVGLLWADLELGYQVAGRTGVGSLHVGEQIVQLGRETATGKPKSDAGERSVALAADSAARPAARRRYACAHRGCRCEGRPRHARPLVLDPDAGHVHLGRG